MKLHVRGIFALMMALLVVSSCRPELENEIEKNPEPEIVDRIVSFTAYTDNAESKTVIDGNVSKWNGEETIQIVGKKNNYCLSTYVSSPSTVATFTYDG